ncbi:hypothetical protein RRSWK_03589 [Rhodopirellula sp. SWK7]|nr:hypothetical protein RRSWK_03589 [Rhodopirellula sp. SWK7]
MHHDELPHHEPSKRVWIGSVGMEVRYLHQANPVSESRGEAILNQGDEK